MTAIWALTAQICMIALGYGAALATGAAFATVAVMQFETSQLTSDWRVLTEAVVIWLSFGITGLQASFGPAAIAIAVCEGMKLRGLVAYLVAAIVVGLATALPLGAALYGQEYPPLDRDALTLTVAAAAVGGFFYWLIAGRTAGRWMAYPWSDGHPR
ncbi:hypothetical protein RDV64_06675 [Acuticoccus sp. MNP-M23]|uniref:hypothetical protein n=1 Tax=Acuticoccus sp. MNP-M23 TaxID=3072793 RepID=UPI0028150270|nr:hypothetical protein [Acuticoccus sp. MNP-M23]WMS44070.1 hypothetical protein RDV64_06675 [Acuticoccus sp. MNP-M23]